MPNFSLRYDVTPPRGPLGPAFASASAPSDIGALCAYWLGVVLVREVEARSLWQ